MLNSLHKNRNRMDNSENEIITIEMPKSDNDIVAPEVASFQFFNPNDLPDPKGINEMKITVLPNHIENCNV